MVKQTEEELVKILKEWQGLEEQTIAFSEDLLKKSDNAFVKVTMEMIKRDSEKHKAMQQFAINHLTKERTHLRPEELIPLGEVLEKHLEAEAKSMSLASDAMAKSRDFFTEYIISYLITDEIKHHEMLNRLDQVKRKMHPYAG